MTTPELIALVRKHPVGFGSALVAVVLGAATYLRSSELPTAAILLDQKSKEGTQLANNVRYGAQLPEQLAALTAAGREIQTHLIRASDLANNLQYFYRLEAETGTKLIELRQNANSAAAKGAKGAFAGVSFSVSLQGEYPVILDFLRRLENGAHYCRVMSANIAPVGPDRNSPLKLALTLELLGQP
jgi:hypothetical protein